jgi:hypothetical protein
MLPPSASLLASWSVQFAPSTLESAALKPEFDSEPCSVWTSADWSLLLLAWLSLVTLASAYATPAMPSGRASPKATARLRNAFLFAKTTSMEGYGPRACTSVLCPSWAPAQPNKPTEGRTGRAHGSMTTLARQLAISFTTSKHAFTTSKLDGTTPKDGGSDWGGAWWEPRKAPAGLAFATRRRVGVRVVDVSQAFRFALDCEGGLSQDDSGPR